jgi:hypothetical protein
MSWPSMALFFTNEPNFVQGKGGKQKKSQKRFPVFFYRDLVKV